MLYKETTQSFYHQKLSLGLNLIFCGYERCTSGHTFGPATRPHYLFHYILNGKGTLFVGNKSYQLQAGEGFMIFPGESTVYSADVGCPWEYCWLAFDGADCDRILKTCGLKRGYPKFTTNHPDDITSQFHQLIENALNNTTQDFLHLARAYSLFNSMAKDNSVVEPDYNDYPAKAVKFIESNYAYDLKVSDIAKTVGLERSYLYRLFMDNFNMSVQEYLIDYRLKEAKKMMIDRDRSITEIAYSCGFKSSSSFNKHFKKRYEMTPRRYREQLR